MSISLEILKGLLCSLLIVFLMFFIMSCKSTKTLNKDFIKSESIKESSEVIKQNASSTLKLTSDKDIKVLQENIMFESESINDNIITIEKDQNKLIEKNQELSNQLNAVHKGILYKVLGFSILFIIISIPLFIYVNQRLAMTVGITGLISASLCIFLIKYLGIIATIIGIAFICTVIYYLIKYKKSLKETVSSFEIIKHKTQWGDEEKNLINDIQSPSTKEVVKEIKGK